MSAVNKNGPVVGVDDAGQRFKAHPFFTVLIREEQERWQEDSRLTCKLHGWSIVRELPRGCPLAAADPFVAVRIALDDSLPAPFEYYQARICADCVNCNLSKPAVRRLRSRPVEDDLLRCDLSPRADRWQPASRKPAVTVVRRESR